MPIRLGWLATVPGLAAESKWVHLDEQGRLKYALLPMGDRIMDFSTAGYLGGGVKIPTVPVRKMVSPSGGDDTTAIQGALDEVSRQQPQDGFRGAVLLAPGIYHCSRTLTIRTGGVVLRGSGSGTDGSVIEMTGAPHLCFSLGHPAESRLIGRPVAMMGPYVPSGVSSFHVSNAEGFQAGDSVLINRPATPAWIRFMGMDTLYRNGSSKVWRATWSRSRCHWRIHLTPAT